MTALPSLPAALTDAGAAVNGLLSRLGGNGGGADDTGGDAFDEAFAGMLAQTGDMRSAAGGATPTPPASPTTPVSATADTGTTPLQQLQTLATSLRHALNQLRHPAATTARNPAPRSVGDANAPRAADTIATPAATGFHAAAASDASSAPTIPVTDDAAADAVTADTMTTAADAPTAGQDIAALLAQLLATVQQVIARLKNDAATGTDGTANASTPASVQTTGSAPSDPTTTGALATALLAAAAEGPGTADAAGGADELADLVALMDKTAQRLAKATDALIAPAATPAATDATTATAIPLTPAMTAGRLAGLGDEIATVLQGIKRAAAPTAGALAMAAAPATPTASVAMAAAAQVATPAALAPAAKPGPGEKAAMPVPAGQAPVQAAEPGPVNTEASLVAGFAATGAAGNGGGDPAGDDDAGRNMAGSAATDTHAATLPEAVAAPGGFAGNLAAVKAATAAASPTPAQVIGQVVLQLGRGVKNGQDQMSLQLSPGELGKITVKLEFGSDGKVQGTVTADNPKTLDMLQKDSRSLERALQDAGLRADSGSLSFNLGQQQGRPDAQTSAPTANGGGNGGTVSASQDGEDSDAVGVVTENYYVTPRGVNIRV